MASLFGPPLLRWLALPVLLVPLAWLLFTGAAAICTSSRRQWSARRCPRLPGRPSRGAQFSSADLAGNPAIVNFWASYCIPSCVDEHPVLLDLASRHGGEQQMIGVLANDTPDGARGFLDRYGQVFWPTLLNADGRISIDYGVTGPPETFFFDADGMVLAPLTSDEIARQLAALRLAP